MKLSEEILNDSCHARNCHIQDDGGQTGEGCTCFLGRWSDDVLKLETVNAVLLEALRRIGWVLHGTPKRIQGIARRAIDRATSDD